MLTEIVGSTAAPGQTVLVFLPGCVEIQCAIRHLAQRNFDVSVHVLHSLVSPQDQTIACRVVRDD